jgi:hypothetical protein
LAPRCFATQAAKTDDAPAKLQLREEADSAYTAAYRMLSRLVVLFPPGLTSGDGSSGTDLVTQVLFDLDAVRRALAQSRPFGEVRELLGKCGTSQGHFAAYVNSVMWARRLTPTALTDRSKWLRRLGWHRGGTV